MFRFHENFQWPGQRSGFLKPTRVKFLYTTHYVVIMTLKCLLSNAFFTTRTIYRSRLISKKTNIISIMKPPPPKPTPPPLDNYF
jgi:hypothetical protein